MNHLATILIAATSVIATLAFASGYGPDPHYRPTEGAPASQRGISTQTMAAEQAAGNDVDQPDLARAGQASAAQAARTVEAGQ